MKCKKLGGIDISEAYLGYFKTDENDHLYISPIDKYTKDNDRIIAVCEINLCDLVTLNGKDSNPKCFEFFQGHADSKTKLEKASTFWHTLGAKFVGSNIVWLVSEDLKDVYLFHESVRILYFLGKVHSGHALEKACLWRYKRIRLN